MGSRAIIVAPDQPLHRDWPQALLRGFRVIIFDWDGTAVADRRANGSKLARLLGRTLSAGIRCGIVTGTRLENVDTQCLSKIPPVPKSRLFVCTNRGSEAFGFDETGDAKLLYRYQASLEENSALDRAAEALKARLYERGLETRIVADRLNRRKVDLIPIPRWKDPPKAAFRELLSAVEDRLAWAHLHGLPEVLDLARQIALSAGLKDPKITSDIKHVEIGLTDKSDSAKWLKNHLVSLGGVDLKDLLVIGDEFGGIGGMPGSDSLMRLPELSDASFVSVGVEPANVPPGVLHLGGGPDHFLELLERQIDLAYLPPKAGLATLIKEQDPSWTLEQVGFDPSREGEMETLFTLGNGYLGIRGASQIPLPSSQPDLFISGIFGEKAPALPYSEVEFTTRNRACGPYCELVPFPSPLHFLLRVGDQDLAQGAGLVRTHSRRLDLERGISFQEWNFEDSFGRKTRVSSSQLASLAELNLVLQEIKIERINHAEPIVLDTLPVDPDFELRHPHLRITRLTGPCEIQRFETKGSGFGVSVESCIFLGAARAFSPKLKIPPGGAPTFMIRRVVQIRDSRAKPEASGLAEFSPEEFDLAIARHLAAWKEFWAESDVRFQGDPATTQELRFNLYHLRIAADCDPHTSPGARGLTGRAYEGHVFWDSEIFLLPFYAHSFPDLARSLLRYRYETLDGARRRARNGGYEGACFAWESTVTGDDVAPTAIDLIATGQVVPIHTGDQQIHVTADVAYAIKRYWVATGDEEYLKDFGTEILIETARFWLSRATERDGRLHFLGVIGPDEHHIHVNDNAYTNWMARFNLETAAWGATWLAERFPDRWADLASKLSLKTAEHQAWSDAAKRVYFPEPNPDGVIEQFEGFFRLERPTLSSDDRFRAPIARLANWEKVNRQQLIKQADVLMIPFLFPNAFPQDVLAATYRYYDLITDHASSLSACVYAAIAARAGFHEDARRYWKTALQLDLTNHMRNTPLGIHLACMGGTWQSLIFHLLEVDWNEMDLAPRGEREPIIPAEVDSVTFQLRFRGRTRGFKIQGDRK